MQLVSLFLFFYTLNSVGDNQTQFGFLFWDLKFAALVVISNLSTSLAYMMYPIQVCFS
jgi:hypothetical protein